MAKPKLKSGLYKSKKSRSKDREPTWHFQIRYRRKAYDGDTGQTGLEAAKEWLKRYRANLAKKGVGWVDPDLVPTLGMALDEWVKLHANQVTDAHLNAVQTSIRIHCKQHLHKRLSDFTTPLIESIRRDYLSTTGVGYKGAVLPHTEGGANTLVKHLRLLLRSQISTSMYDTRPLEQMPFEIEDLPSQEEAGSTLWPERVAEFLNLAQKSPNPDAYTALAIMLSLGLREDEALSLRWECLSWEASEYTVTGDRQAQHSTKNRKSRKIAVQSWLIAHLRQRWDAAGKPSKGLIMSQPNGQKHARGYTAKPIARCAREMGLHGIHPHSLRAAFATAHYEAGTPLGQIQLMLGHASPDTTLGYISKRPFRQAEAQEHLSKHMRLGQDPTLSSEIEYHI